MISFKGDKGTLQSLHLSGGGHVTTVSTSSIGTNLRDTPLCPGCPPGLRPLPL